METQTANTTHVDEFFASLPTTPSELLSGRRSLLNSTEVVDKIESKARTAREANDHPAAAIAAWLIGDYNNAIDSANEIGDDSDFANFLAASSLLELDRRVDAAERLKGKFTTSDKSVNALCLQAMLASRDNEGFEAAYKKAKLNEADQLYFAGRQKELEREYQEACQYYEKTLELDSRHTHSRFRLAFRADLHGDDRTAIQHYESFNERLPIPTSALINLGLIYDDNNDYERACGCFSAVQRRDPSNRLAKMYFADAHDSLNMFYDENAELKEDQMMKVLRTPISDFELSVRARNCLTNMGINTLEKLVSYTEADMLEWKNFGETSLSEIKRLLVQKGLRLGMRRDDGSFMVPDDFDAARSINLEEELKWMGPLSDEQKEALELQISTLNLSVRCHRALVERLNLQRIGDALLYSEEDLLGMPNFGITSLNELQLKLKDYNLHIRSGRGEEAFLG
ncbi:MAG: DNA-directed RNA polymerase subunit alpha C-terminal domain-containing protein [Planctomycetota bacterium]|nr:DNA-directed RNA polymerase subunit alpha C-terminal domain-containing protein [Planctomycetota bacterium]